MQYAFSVTKVNANSTGVINVKPDDSPYFEPCHISFRSFDCTGSTLDDLDFKIGAVTCGGSPQLGINRLTPTKESEGISPKDLDEVNWSVFSTRGLGRELQISVYNPHDVDLLIYTCIRGVPIASLQCYAPSPGNDEQESLMVDCPECGAPAGNPCKAKKSGKNKPSTIKRPHRVRKEAKLAKDAEGWMIVPDEGDRGLDLPHGNSMVHVASDAVNIAPRGHKVVQVFPMVSPFMRPWKSKVHAEIDKKKVPLIVVDILCGRQMILGGAIQMLGNIQYTGQPQIGWGPYEILKQLHEHVVALEHGGWSGMERRRMEAIEKAPMFEVEGIPSDLLEGDGWCDISSISYFSTNSLSKHLCYLLYNPWPFTVRASVTVMGEAMMRTS